MLSSGVGVKDPTKPLSRDVLSDRMDFRIRVDDYWNRVFFVCGFSLPGFVWTGPESAFAITVTCVIGKLFSQFRRCNPKRPVP